MPPNVAVLWAKTRRGAGEPAFHPLICHLVDAAAVAEALWRTVIPPAARARLAKALAVDEDAAGRWVAIWAGLHDLGKASPAFQAKDGAARGRVEAAGLPWLRGNADAPHGTISTRALQDLLLTAPFGMRRDLAMQVATAVGGHHGVFPRSDEVQGLPREAVGRAVWHEARAAIAAQLARVFLPPPAPQGTLGNAAAMWLAGLVSVADWIGSDERYFDYAVSDPTRPPPIDLLAYARHATAQSAAALRHLGWIARPTDTEPRTFAALFPRLEHPYPVQRAAADLAGRLAGPSLVVVEAPMGEGKTEAAMFLADHANAVLGQRGHVFALPTRATSDQMFGRVLAFLRGRYPADVINLLLLHGHAALSAELDLLERNGKLLLTPREVYGDDGRDGAPAGVIAAEWFTYRKRGLLAPFGVGTIDQALLAVLQTRHGFVRLFGLADKTVIIDEAHAYDTYMTTLLERLLAWLGALDCSVVVLSATLPSARRQRLLGAYAAGRGSTPPVVPTEARYPRLTWVNDASAGAEHVEAASRRTVGLVWLDEGDLSPEAADRALGERLVEALAGGGCAAVICNTVRRAQEVYRALEPFFPGAANDGGPVLDLLHARFLFEEREARERRALIRFGKADGQVVVGEQEVPVRRPDRAVLVATQVIEQSLDLDFDLMVTELAPADLVLQRSGRLHRHDRLRPAGLRAPTLWLRGSTSGDAAPIFDSGTAAVYDRHVLLRSWLALRDRTELRIPDDVEDLIEAVYAEDRPCPDDVGEAIRLTWDETLARQQATLRAETDEAQKRWLKSPSFGGLLWRLTEDPREEDAPDFHREHQALTRLAQPSVAVVCLYGTPEQPAFDPAGTERVSLSAPGVKLAERLLRRSVQIGDRRVVHDLLRRPVPAGWQRSPLLRHHRLVVLDETGAEVVGNYRLRLEQDIGLRVVSLQREEG